MHSHKLTQIPDLGGAPNIVSINLECCTSLVGISSYNFQRLYKLTYLNLGFCDKHKFAKHSNHYDSLNQKDSTELSGDLCDSKLHVTGVEELPSLIGSQTLDTYTESQLPSSHDLADGRLTIEPPNRFAKLPRNIKELYLSDIRMTQVPSSIQYLSTLKELYLRNCKNLESLPITICRLKFLEKMCLSGCSKFENFPEILEPMEHLWFLSLARTSIKRLPSSIENLIGLQKLLLPMCDHFELVFSACKLERLDTLNLSGCSRLARLSPLLIAFCNLKKLDLSNCNIQEILEDLSCLSSVEWLDLHGNNFEGVPTSIKHLSKLVELDVSNCRWLKSLPELPSSLERLYVHDCELLEMVSSSKAVLVEGWDRHHAFDQDEMFLFVNCQKLDLNARNNIIADAQLRIWKAAMQLGKKVRPSLFMSPNLNMSTAITNRHS